MKARIEFDTNENSLEELYALLIELRMEKNKVLNYQLNFKEIFTKSLPKSVSDVIMAMGVNLEELSSQFGKEKQPVLNFLSKTENSLINVLLAKGESEFDIAQKIEISDKASERSLTMVRAILFGEKPQKDKDSN